MELAALLHPEPIVNLRESAGMDREKMHLEIVHGRNFRPCHACSIDRLQAAFGNVQPTFAGLFQRRIITLSGSPFSSFI